MIHVQGRRNVIEIRQPGEQPEIRTRGEIPTDTLIRLAFRAYKKEAAQLVPPWEQVQARIFETLQKCE